MPYIVTSECILCGACVVGCESNAITEGDTQSYIDPELCVECGTCERNCPSEAIIYVEDAESVTK
jgi:ferredoxin